jgi:transposase
VGSASSGSGRLSYEELETLVAEQAALIDALQARITEQAAVIEEFERRVNRNSSNSSLPPSSDQPLTRAERRRRAREKLKQMSKQQRKPGGQPGHEGKHRVMAPAERVARRSEHLPAVCGCGHRFAGSEERAGDPVIHQQWELPPIRPLIFQYDLVRLRCPCCRKPRLAELPAGVSWSPFAPRLQAHIGVLAGVYRLSRRQVRDVVGEMFGIPISTGAVDATIMRMSVILKDPWEQLRASVQAAQQVHADETGWRLRGAYECLWVATTALAACYRIDPHRSQAAAKELLGEEFGGFVICDRYVGYHWLDVLQQQLCWAHAIRQLVALSERPGAPGKLGRKLLDAAREVIKTHRRSLQDDHDLDWLRAQLAPLREQIQTLLEKGARGRDQKTANFCAGLLEEYNALWTFCDVQDLQIPITNNAAERALRHAVILRRVQGGTQSDHGSRWIERILSIRETMRLQDRSALDYLIQAANAWHAGQPAPSPLAAGP